MKNYASPNLWSGQLLHFLALSLLLSLTGFLWIKIGRPFPLLFWLTIAVPVVHQVFVWITWRSVIPSDLQPICLSFFCCWQEGPLLFLSWFGSIVKVWA